MSTKHRWLLADELRVRADVVESINDLALLLGQTLDFNQQKALASTR